MKRVALNKMSDKKKALLERELPIKCEIIKRAKGRCGDCGEESKLPLYPLQVHHKKIGADREEIKSVEDGVALCIVCHSKAHGIKVVFSEPRWSNNGIKGV